MRRHAKQTYSSATLLLALAAFLVLAPLAQAQDSDIGERLDRLERDLNMLQRQVYGSGYRGQELPGAGSNLAVHVEIRTQRLEEEVRRLRGRVEDEMNSLKDLRQRVDALSNAVGLRSNERAAGPPPSAANAMPSAPPAALTSPEGNAVAAPPPPAELVPPGGGGGSGALFPPSPPPPYGTPAPPEEVPPGAQTANATEGLRPPGGDLLPQGSALAQYNEAFGRLKTADYEGAARAMKSFLREHPDDPLAGNAQYWLGETYYVRGRYQEAARAFAAGYKKYPNSAKAPDDLLKLAMSLARADEKREACVAFAQLHRVFPHPGSAIAGEAGTEEKRLGC